MIITEKMKTIVANHSIGTVGTVNSNGTPNVSSKGTMVVIDNETIIFGEIRSPHTLANISKRPAMEINFVDVLARLCFRASGEAEALPRNSEDFNTLLPHFERWGDLAGEIKHIVRLKVTKGLIVSTPAYDLGQTKEELIAYWKAHFASL